MSFQSRSAHADPLLRLYSEGTLTGLTDHELLLRFQDRGDQQAFALLVQRFGAMVKSVCRQVLGDGPDAEDAFQATFLILAGRGYQLRQGDLLSAWLHRVALRVAKRALLNRRRTGSRILLVTDLLDRFPGRDRPLDPDRTLIHRELDRLPDAYRRVIVLCDLEGYTQAEAAERLNWSLGSVKGRLSRGRELLRSRLARLGLGLSTAAIVEFLGSDAHGSMNRASVDGILNRFSGTSTSSIVEDVSSWHSIQELAEGVMMAMYWDKVRRGITWVGAMLFMGFTTQFALSRATRIGDPMSVPILEQIEVAREPELKGPGESRDQRPAESPSLLNSLQGSWTQVAVDNRRVLDLVRMEIGLAPRKPGQAPPLPSGSPDLDVNKHPSLQLTTRFSEPGSTLHRIAVIDPNSSPASIDLYLDDSRIPNPMPMCGVIRLDGDVLTLCVRGKPGLRATEFRSDVTQGWTLEVYIRDRTADLVKPQVAQAEKAEDKEASRKESNRPAQTLRVDPAISDANSLIGSWRIEQIQIGPETLQPLATNLVFTKTSLFMPGVARNPSDADRPQIHGFDYETNFESDPITIRLSPRSRGDGAMGFEGSLRVQSDHVLLTIPAASILGYARNSERPSIGPESMAQLKLVRLAGASRMDIIDPAASIHAIRDAARARLLDIERERKAIDSEQVEVSPEAEIHRLSLDTLREQIKQASLSLLTLEVERTQNAERKDGIQSMQFLQRNLEEMQIRYEDVSRRLIRCEVKLQELKRRRKLLDQAEAGIVHGIPPERPPGAQPGDLIRIEVLEALPGRPITGPRRVREDGTISLDFYGDLSVLGLSREQIKHQVIELLRRFITDETLGLMEHDPVSQKWQIIPPEQSTLVVVDHEPRPGYSRERGAYSNLETWQQPITQTFQGP